MYTNHEPHYCLLLEFNNAFEIPKLENPEIGSKELIEPDKATPRRSC